MILQEFENYVFIKDLTEGVKKFHPLKFPSQILHKYEIFKLL